MTYLEEFKLKIAEDYGMAIIARSDYFDQDNKMAKTGELQEFLFFINGIVKAHDVLAELKGENRIHGKRGRKVNDEKPSTLEDVICILDK